MLSRDDGGAVRIDLERDVVDEAVRRVFQVLRVGAVLIVDALSHDNSRASGRIGTFFLGADLKPHEEPPVADVPVILPRGGGYGIHLDPGPGDLGVLLCCDGPVRGVFETGQQVSPQIVQGNEHGTAVFFPGGRVSPTEVPVPPPNPPGTMLVGAEDGTATITCAGAAAVGPAPPDLGSVVVATSGPLASLRLGGPAASVGAARLGDPVAASAEMSTVLSAMVAAINVLAPGTVTPPQLAAALAHLGDISGASAKVVLEP